VSNAIAADEDALASTYVSRFTRESYVDSGAILDDHNGYVTSDYVEATARLIDSVKTKYDVEASRVYGTGQSMGCMTMLILASAHPHLYAGCMFVGGLVGRLFLEGARGPALRLLRGGG
jgi:poly(3-hydroxybutyrate) depolymerase